VARRGDRVFLFGGTPEVNELAAEALARRYAGVRIVGREHGYIKEDDMPALIHRINESQPDILFVALGSPKQELWMDRHLPHLRIKLCQGVGGTFDVLAGRARRAPRLVRACHLEWLYRLVSNPSRVARQVALPRFAWLVLRELVAR
jgi:N-acetylglucosaminyldiphosphoundecaprenol N-acetyl-beta-D-mannosaminyltransferase